MIDLDGVGRRPASSMCTPAARCSSTSTPLGSRRTRWWKPNARGGCSPSPATRRCAPAGGSTACAPSPPHWAAPWPTSSTRGPRSASRWTGPDQIALTDADLEGLRTWSDLRGTAGEASSLGVLRVLGGDDGALRRGRVVGDPRRGARDPDEPHARRGGDRARLRRRDRLRPAHRNADRRRAPATSRERPDVLRRRSSATPRRRSCAESASSTCPASPRSPRSVTAAELSEILSVFHRECQRRGARRRWPGRQVHRRRGDVGQPHRRRSWRPRRPTWSSTRRPAEAGMQGPGWHRLRTDPRLGRRLLRQRGQPRRPAGRGRRGAGQILATNEVAERLPEWPGPPVAAVGAARIRRTGARVCAASPVRYYRRGGRRPP